MSGTLITGMGIKNPGRALVFDVSQGGGEGCAVMLSDELKVGPPGTQQNQWIVEVAAQGREGFAPVGRVLTQRPDGNVEPKNRMVAIGNAPGACGWRATFRGAVGQRAYVTIISGGGVGAGMPGVISPRPRPRDFFRGGNGRIVTNFDTILLGLSVTDADVANPGVWFMAFNKATAAVNGDVPIFERFVPTHGSFDIQFDASQQLGDPRYTRGYVWAVSSTPAVLTLSPVALGVTSVLG